MTVPRKIKGRYEIKDVLGQGGMGVVYRAVDTDPSMRGREVALKTIRESPDPGALELFEKERLVLASLNHPNIVDIFDSGEFEEDGERKPFFVMPLLKGQPLSMLIRTSSHRLTVERAVEIFTQTCRGLHAAHERGLVHRDLKPSNIFVLSDDSVKIIDFGVAHMVDNRSSRGQKGTLLYMSPEQLEMKTVSAASDIFSLGVVCYETLTKRRPFDRPTQSGMFDAILHEVPPPVSELNPAANTLLSRVIQKAMAKQTWHRFSSAREFAETLQKALRNEPIAVFDSARLRPRLERAKKALEDGDYEFAGEILSEMEAEGHVDPEMGQLRRQTNQAVLKKRVRQLLEAARGRLDEGEDPLALQKVDEALELDRDNVEALALKAKIESQRGEKQIESWLSLAHQHIENRAYSHARQALQNVLQLRPQEGRALQLLDEVEREEQEYLKLRRQKEALYQAAQDAWHGGDISTALEEMGQVVTLDRRAPDTTSPERSAAYQSFYNQVRSDHDAITNAQAEARKHLAEDKFDEALALCDEFLAKYPNHALFKALKGDIQAQQRHARSAYIAEINRRVLAEPDLDKRLSILREALVSYPQEADFERSLRLLQERHELVETIVAKARLHEERGQFSEAMGQWEILRTIYEHYPGLNFEIERVTKRRDQQSRSQAKARWVEQIDNRLASENYSDCLDLVRKAQSEFPDDPELAEIEKLARQGLERGLQSQQLLAQGQEACAEKRFEEGLVLLRRAQQMAEWNPAIRDALLENLSEQARRLVDTDWRAADRLAQEALELDASNPIAKNIRVLVEDRKRQEAIDQWVTDVRRLQAANDLPGALQKVEMGLLSYRGEERLLRLRDTIERALGRPVSGASRQRDLEQVRRLGQDIEVAPDPEASETICDAALEIAGRHHEDPEFDSMASIFRERRDTLTALAPKEVEKPVSNVAQPPVAPIVGEDLHQGERVAGPVSHAEAEGKDQKAGLGRYSRTWLLALIAAATLGVALTAFVLWVHRPHQLHPPNPTGKSTTVSTIEVIFNTDPQGATIRITDSNGSAIPINGQDRGETPISASLKEGTYNLVVQRDGYQPAAQTLEVKQGMNTTVALPLKPLSLKLRVTTDLKSAQIDWDQGPSGGLTDGNWGNADVQPGSHSLQVSSGPTRVATVTFDAQIATIPALSAPPDTKNTGVVTVSTFGTEGHVEFTFHADKIVVDSQSYEWKAGGIDLNGLQEGPHTLTWEDNRKPRTENFECGPAPGLEIFVSPRSEPVATVKPPVQVTNERPQQNLDPQAQRIAALKQQMYQASKSQDFAGALGYVTQMLQLDKTDSYAMQVRDYSRQEIEKQINDAVAKKDFPTADQLVGVLVTNLPDDEQVQDIQRRVKAAEDDARKPVVPKPERMVWSDSATYILSDRKLSGTLEVVSHRLRFRGSGQGPGVDLACSDLQLRDKGLHKRRLQVSTSSGTTFEFETSHGISKEVESACKQ